jgi:hypothetical protein
MVDSVSMTPAEKTMAAVKVQPLDYVPVAVDMGYWVAHHSGVTIHKFLTDMRLQMELQHKAFEELKWVDYIQEFPSGTVFNRVSSFSHMPMKIKLPGVELPPDVAPQYEETELMPFEAYDLLIKKGWMRYALEDLVPKYYPNQKDPGMIYDEEADFKYYSRYKVFFPRLGPPATLPFDLLSYGRSLSKISLDIYRNPDKIIAAMDAIFPELLKDAVDGIREQGAPVLFPASRSSAGFLSPKNFERFSLPYLLKIVDAITAKGSPIFFHLDQTWTKLLPYFKLFPKGTYMLHLDGMTDVIEAKKIVGDRMCIMGDVPARLLKLGTPDQVTGYCKNLIKTIGRGGGYILSAGCSVPDDASFANIQAMVDAAHNIKVED